MRDSITRRGVLRTVAAGGAATVVAGGTATAERAPEERIVGTASRRAERAAKERADRVDRVLDFDHIGKAVVGRFSDEAAENLSKRGDVRYVEHNGTMEKFAETLPWGVDRIDADVVHADGGTGAGTTVAVLDTGIDDDHPDLAGNVVGGKAFETECGAESGGCRFGAEGYNGNDCNHAWSDDDDHGSHVAGTSDALDNTEGVIGVATEADLLAGKVLTGCGSGTYSAIADGVRWATDQGADVINMSLGGDSGSSTLKDACQYAYDNNVVTVAAAGNDGPCSDCVGYPAAYSTVVAVSATTPSDTLADYSSTGPEVEIAAPGGANDGNDSTSILSTIPPESDDTDGDGYAYFVGTSMASPHVAGAAAVVKAETSLSDNQQIIDRLKSSAEDVGLASNEGGAGLVDVQAAVGSSGGDTSVAVSTDAASSVGTDNATLNGTLDDLGGASSADVYFEWGQSGGGLSNTTSTQTLSSTGSFSADLSGLSSGTDYDYRAVAEASDGDTDTGSTVTFTTDSSTSNSAPAIDSYTVTEAGSPNPHAEITADWSVSDADGNLDTVLVEVVDADTGSVVDSSTTSVSGSSASGSDSFKIKGRNETYDVTLTVTDTDGASASQTKQVTE